LFIFSEVLTLGRSVIQTGARSKNEKLQIKNDSKKLKEMKVHQGPVHVYRVFAPDERPKKPQSMKITFCCNICRAREVGKICPRSQKTLDLIQGQLNSVL
jgi:hypothetical protein